MSDLVEKIVKRDDIRAKTPEPLNRELAYKIGVALANHLKEKTEGIKRIIIGQDMRLSSPILADTLSQGISSQEIKVERLGRCSTETISFVAGEKKVPAVMVTASHNPKEYNGFKIFQAGAMPIGRNALEKVVRDAEKLSETRVVSRERLGTFNIDKDYVEKVLSVSNICQEGYGGKIPVVIDAGNGMGGQVFKKIAKKLSWLKAIYYYDKPDGNIPSGIMPNPLDPRYMRRLAEEVAKEKALLGVGFDGDADRAGFVYRSEGGEVSLLTPSQVGSLIAKQVLEGKGKKSKILYNLVCSALIPELVEKLGGIPVMTPVGYGKVRERMFLPENSDCLFALEHSGHYCYRDFYGADSAMITALIVLDTVACLAAKGENLSSIISPWQTRFFQSDEINFEFSKVWPMKECIKRVRKEAEKEMEVFLVQKYSPGDPIDTKKILKYRGILFEESPCPGHWWFCLRPSENEPTKLRLIAEVILNEEMPEAQRIKLGPEILTEKINQLVNIVDKERS